MFTNSDFTHHKQLFTYNRNILINSYLLTNSNILVNSYLLTNSDLLIKSNLFSNRDFLITNSDLSNLLTHLESTNELFCHDSLKPQGDQMEKNTQTSQHPKERNLVFKILKASTYSFVEY